MTENKNTEIDRPIVLKIPFEVIQKVALDAVESGRKLESTLDALAAKWAIIVKDEEGLFFTEGHEEYDKCAGRVAYFHGTEFQVQYVLRNGSPRKNVRVEVKARL